MVVFVSVARVTSLSTHPACIVPLKLSYVYFVCVGVRVDHDISTSFNVFFFILFCLFHH